MTQILSFTPPPLAGTSTRGSAVVTTQTKSNGSRSAGSRSAGGSSSPRSGAITQDDMSSPDPDVEELEGGSTTLASDTGESV